MVSFRNRIAAPLATFALFLASYPSSVQGHGYLVKPKTTFSGYGGGYSAIVQNSTLTPPAGKRFVWYQDQIAGIFEAALTPTGQSLKDFILANQDTSVQAEGAPKPHSAACGYSLPTGTPQELPDKLQWQMDFQHPGPCEVYCDDELVVPYTTDCWATFSDNAIPYSKAKCVGKKQLTLYFLAVHYPPWQVYINCVPLSGATSEGSSGSIAAEATDAPAVAATKKPATSAPAATTAKPTPTTTTSAPAATKAKPTPTTKSATPEPTSSSAKPITSSPPVGPPVTTTAPSTSKLCNTKTNRKLQPSFT